MVRNINLFTMLTVIVIAIYGYFIGVLLKLLPFLAFMLAVVIFLNGIQRNHIRKSLFIISVSLFLISILRILSY
ncbi:hypothetical protein V7056_19735 [Bacillus sp. JJ664]